MFEFYDALWVRRYQNDAEADALDELSRLLFELARQYPDEPVAAEIAWRRARCSHFAGMVALEAKRPVVAQTKFAEGAALISFAQLSPDFGAPSRFWWAVNAIEAARLQNLVTVLKMLRPVRQKLETALRLDETFHFAGPHRVLGRFFHFAPPLVGGDGVKAEAHFRRALEISDNTTTRNYWGDLLLSQGRQAEAVAQWKAVLNAPDEEEWRWERARDQRLARAYLEHYGN